jgi:type II secretory pathway component PulF
MSSVSEKTSTIDDESLAMLLDEVSSMAASGRALDVGLVDLEDAAMGKFGRAARQVRAGLSRGEPAANVIAALSPKYQAPIRVAMQIMTNTGSTEPIDEAVRFIRDVNEHRQQTFLAALNPLINVIVAATVLFFVMPWILVSISEAELIKPAFAPSVREIQHTFANNFMLATFAAIVVISLFATLLYWMLTRSLLKIDTIRDHATFCRWLAMQVMCVNQVDVTADARKTPTTNTEVGQVIESAATVVGTQFAESWATAITNMRGGANSSDSITIPDRTPAAVAECVIDLVAGRRDGASIALDLRQLSERYRYQSHRQRAWWINGLPRWIAGVVMITIIVLMLQTMIAPLLDVVGEVVR